MLLLLLLCFFIFVADLLLLLLLLILLFVIVVIVVVFVVVFVSLFCGCQASSPDDGWGSSGLGWEGAIIEKKVASGILRCF